MTAKDYAKIGVIAGIITIPLVIAYGSAGYFEENGRVFWSDWGCDQIIDFSQSQEFNRISEEQQKLYELDLKICIDRP